jgi:two-component system nitrogen regulation response regulator NtrX
MEKNEAAILVVDDESKIGKIISDILTFKGYQVIVCLSGEEALKILTKKNIDLILADLMMPGITGKEVLNHVTRNYPEIPVVIISAYGSVKVAVEAIKEGAYDFIEKPLDADRLLITIKNALEKRNLSLKTKRLQEDIVSRYQMIGNSPAIHHVFKQIEIFAPTNSKVLITGESGTGKDLVAQALHDLSPRVGFPFVKINCAAIPDSLVESELFGYEKGAFTGAASTKKGRIEMSNQGALFLDEIGDLKLELQAKLLRLIENQEFERLGSLKTIKVDFRLITATNKNLELDVKEGRFREDLYYRLKTSHIHLAPLRERKEDIPQLAQYFLDQFCEENNLAVKNISNNVLKDLNAHNWPGNIRELKNYIYNLASYFIDKEVIEKLPDKEQGVLEYDPAINKFYTLKDGRIDFEIQHITKVLNKTNWNVSESAKMLGLERTHLHKKIKKLGISK